MPGNWFDDNGYNDDGTTSPITRPGGRLPVGSPYEAGTMPVGQPVPVGGSGTATAVNSGAIPQVNATLSGGSGGGGTPDIAALQAIFSKYPTTNEGFLQGVQEADATFGKGVWGTYLDHPQRLDKIQLPNGQTFDIMQGAGAPGASWKSSWAPEGHSGGGAGAAGTLGGMMGGNWQAGQDPSYGFIYDEAIKALDKSNAARGISKTGGAYKALVGLGANLASTEFGNIFGRNLSLAQLGVGAAGTAAGAGSSYNNAAGNLTGNQSNQNTNLVTGAGNAEAAGTVGSANAWGNTIGGLANIGGQWMAGRKANQRQDGTV